MPTPSMIDNLQDTGLPKLLSAHTSDSGHTWSLFSAYTGTASIASSSTGPLRGDLANRTNGTESAYLSSWIAPNKYTAAASIYPDTSAANTAAITDAVGIFFGVKDANNYFGIEYFNNVGSPLLAVYKKKAGSQVSAGTGGVPSNVNYTAPATQCTNLVVKVDYTLSTPTYSVFVSNSGSTAPGTTLTPVTGMQNIADADLGTSGTASLGVYFGNFSAGSTNVFSLTNIEFDDTSATMTASPTTVSSGSGANTITLTGSGTAFTVGTSSQFTLSGGTGATLSSPNATTTTAATVSVNPGTSTAGAVLTITHTASGASTTVTVTTTIAPGTPSATIKITSSGDIITIPSAVVAGTNAVSSYKLYQGNTSGGESGTAVATLTASGLTFPAPFPAQTRATAGNAHYFYVKAVDSVGTLSTASNEVKSATSAITPNGVTYTFTSGAVYGTSGLASTLGYTIYDATGAVLSPYTVGGASEIGTTGIYTIAATLDTAWNGTIVWDAPTGSVAKVDVFDKPASSSSVVTGYATGQDPATLVLDAVQSAHNTAGTIGNKIGTASSAGDPWSTSVPGAYAAGTAGAILGALSLTSIASAVWAAVTSGLTTAGSIGLKLKNWVLGTDNKALISTDTGNVATVGGYATGQDPATLILDVAQSGHNTSGTIGNKIGSAASAGDPLTSVVPGSYGPGTAGAALGTLSAVSGIKKNTALLNFPFYLVASSDHVTPRTGLGTAVTASRSIDGGSFVACTNTPTELGSGFYLINLSASDLNGTNIAFQFSGSGADVRPMTIKTNS